MKAAQFKRLLRVHASRRLVEQQQLRTGRQRAGNFKPALLAIRQSRRQLVLYIVKADDFQQLQRLFALRSLLLMVGAERGGKNIGRAAHVHGRQDVFKNGHGLEQTNVLERARDAALCNLVGRVGDGRQGQITLRLRSRIALFHLAARMVADDGSPMKSTRPLVGS